MNPWFGTPWLGLLAGLAAWLFPAALLAGTPLTPLSLPDLFRNPPQGTVLIQPAEMLLVALLQFDDLHAQARAMNRMAVFLEKKGSSQQQPLDDAGLAAWFRSSGQPPERLYLGHDYRARDLARFFTRAHEQGITLNPDETALREQLAGLGFITLGEQGSWLASEPERALITLPALGEEPVRLPPISWRETLRHELSHGEFFTNPDYRRHCLEQWQALDDAVRRIFLEEFHYLGYDRENQELMVNEWQAFLWEPVVGGFIAMRLYRMGSSLDQVREGFLRSLDRLSRPVTRMFDFQEFRRVPKSDGSSSHGKTTDRGGN